MPTRTRKTNAEHAADFKHVIEEIFDIDSNDVDHPIRKALDRANILRVRDILHLSMESIDALEFVYKDSDNAKQVKKLSPLYVDILKSFKRWIIYLELSNLPIIDDDWQQLDPSDYDTFARGPNNSDKAIAAMQNSSIRTTTTSSTFASKTSDPVKD